MAPGLCGTCIHCRLIRSDRGSVFYLCGMALRQPDRFTKYPHIPVRECYGWMGLRHATAEDVPQIQKIYGHWVTTGIGSFETDPPSEAEMLSRMQSVQSHKLPYLVAETPELQIAGYAYCTPYRPRQAYRFTVEDSVYIHPDFAGQGIGNALLQALIADCSSKGYKQMIAVIGGGMENAGSVALHAKCGFEHAGNLNAVGYKFDRWLDTAFMQRSLEP
ncbi:phosphinothricin N-acetyltransferase [Bryobacterales bacterium F-183]|nr:phosphinothricin N-acetyltransferase [Bryobacterales bacterium F-183]